MSDQQIAFLIYFGNLQNENKQLKADLQDTRDSITWWENRFNAVSNQNTMLRVKLSRLEKGDKHE